MPTHTEAKEWAAKGFESIFGREPTLLERQWVQVVALAESQYGAGWKGEGVGSWNMGAVQAGKPPCNPATSFLYTDTHPNSDGTSTPYSICFRKYPGPVEGMADVARILFKQMKIEATTIRELSTQMYDKHYYEGFGSTREVRINNHVKYITSFMTKMTKALNEPMPPVEGGAGTDTPKAPPDSDLPLSEFLALLALSLFEDADEKLYMTFPPQAKKVVKRYQASRNLKPDGVVGTLTLTAMAKEEKDEN